jgi:hypothetical protein
MAAILKFNMAAAGGRFLSGTHPEMNQYQKSTSVPDLVFLYRFARFSPTH